VPTRRHLPRWHACLAAEWFMARPRRRELPGGAVVPGACLCALLGRGAIAVWTGLRGHTVCGECQPDYDGSNLACLPCVQSDDSAERILRYIGIPSFYSTMCALVAVLPDARLDQVIVFTMILQQIVVFLGPASAWIDAAWLRSVYVTLKLVTFDYSFVRPGCSIGKLPFATLYFMELGLTGNGSQSVKKWGRQWRQRQFG
jgi:hypothetical protein